MKKISILSAIVLLFATLISSCGEKQSNGSAEADQAPKAPQDTAMMVQAVKTFKEAGLSSDYEKAITPLHEKSIQHFKALRDATLYEGKEQILARPFVEKVAIMQTRIKAVNKQALIDLNPVQYFQYLVRTGYLSKNVYTDLEVAWDDISYGDGVATAPLMLNGQKQEQNVYFRDVNGEWKMDLSEAYPAIYQKLEDDLTANGQSADYVFELILKTTNRGEELPDEVWEPFAKDSAPES
jgi:hypothetical protein